jgi:hypothetical protein
MVRRADGSGRDTAAGLAAILGAGGLVAILVGIFRSAYLFSWDSETTLGHRSVIVLGAIATTAAALLWWRRGRRAPAVVVEAMVVVVLFIAFRLPDLLFLAALLWPFVTIIGLMAAAAGSSRRAPARHSGRLYGCLAVVGMAVAATGALVPAAGLLVMAAGGGAGTAYLRRIHARDGIGATA